MYSFTVENNSLNENHHWEQYEVSPYANENLGGENAA